MADQTGSGQQYPGDGATPHNAMMFAISQVLGRVRTITIGQVVGIEEIEDGFVDVKPMIKQMDGGNNVTPHGTVYHVPFVRLQGGKNAVQVDPAKDDFGILLICDRDVSAFSSNKAESQPGSNRRFDLADAVYLGGLLNGEPEQTVKFTDDGLELNDKNGNKLTSDAAGWKFVGNVVFQNNVELAGTIAGSGGGAITGNLQIAGTITGNTDVVAAGKSLKAHTHPVTSAPGTTGPNS